MCIGEDPVPAAIQPLPFAMYFVAYDNDRPVGMAEIAYLDQVYGSFDDSPYPQSLNLGQFCPIEKMAGIRTIYVEPVYRRQAASLFLQLVFAGAKLTYGAGARFGTATTNAADTYLGKLYRKTGGWAMEPFRMSKSAKIDAALFVFEIGSLIENRLVRRAASAAEIEIEPAVLEVLRSRSPQSDTADRRCA